MKDVYTVAHTHWDFEWYFTRQEARVQFIFHMDEVLTALESNQLDYYALDGQMSIIEDYLAIFPEKAEQLKRFVTAGRLFVGPWFTQIDEMTTSGESTVRNLRIGIQEAENLGNCMRIGYLPDSFGQSQDMPKIFNGFGIEQALFWRGMPKDAKTRYFYWTSNDGSKVLTANIKNGYYAGVDLIEQDNFTELVDGISTETKSSVHLLPVGGDQRAVDFNLKERIAKANHEVEKEVRFVESSYPDFFKALERETSSLKEISGEFIDPSDSKIHRGIYSSRYDLKQIYDQLERVLTYQLEPMSALANTHGIETKQGLLNSLWKTVARGQAHDSAGGCNSDKTNQDILMRGVNALQEAQSCMDYLLRKLSISLNSNQENDLFIWNPLPFAMTRSRKMLVSTKSASFALVDQNGNKIDFEIVEQQKENAGCLRRDRSTMINEYYYETMIIVACEMPAMSWVHLQIVETETPAKRLQTAEHLENDQFLIQFQNGKFDLFSKINQKWYVDFLKVEDGGDEGDTYDFSPAFDDWLLNLDFSEAGDVNIQQGSLISRMTVSGQWKLPYDLAARKAQKLNGVVHYALELELAKDSSAIDLKMTIDNQVLDHRLRLLIQTDVEATHSYADTQFGVIKRPVEDIHLHDWQAIGYKEEPTSMRPMLHFCNIHAEDSSWSFLTKGTKDFQIVGENYQTLAVTLFRGVGFLGRPDTLRRPGDASGLQTKVVPTPQSQLLGKLVFEGSIVINSHFDPQELQMTYLAATQEDLYYQTQTINRFTTPIQYFPVNPLQKEIAGQPLISIEDLSVVFSSFLPTIDNTGFELRLYNAADTVKTQSGKLLFKQSANIVLLDLEGRFIRTVAANVTEYELADFNSGEIRTYGIYFNQRKSEEIQ
ncbi:glycoside hydrolase family 38 C-terminal domain-containing protein [Enterococcus devriesei]|uniref:glycoside hydrolase family 38 N-terminal domain-containing protein n=1 Tax=Enterococcus devriesei TaxID=319970 RepID=UPI00288D410A|nr:glycoside hydrolase family 38 C-terminal domain-containing protein [Enterococcus devriesei]MDT2821036.1 glycoside hydrolase family 38 C-terminal domain-containing protein [Enterococcus devriesei]